MTAAELTPEEIAAALAARRELGPDYEDAIASSLAEKVEREIAARVNAAQMSAMQMQVNAVQGNAPRQRRQPDASTEGRWIAVTSLVAGIPVTGIVAGTSNGNVAAIAVAWAGIALVNMAHAFGRRKH